MYSRNIEIVKSTIFVYSIVRNPPNLSNILKRERDRKRKKDKIFFLIVVLKYVGCHKPIASCDLSLVKTHAALPQFEMTYNFLLSAFLLCYYLRGFERERGKVVTGVSILLRSYILRAQFNVTYQTLHIINQTIAYSNNDTNYLR